MYNNLKFKNQDGLSAQAGVTLVEVLVSLFMFGIALGALMFLLTTVLTSADDLRNNTIAAGLAQEGLEVVRAIRDQDWIASSSFGTSIPNGDWEVQWDDDALMPYADRLILKAKSTGILNYSSGAETQFKRKITISSPNANEKIISGLVFWRSSNGTTRSLQAESHLYNWR